MYLECFVNNCVYVSHYIKVLQDWMESAYFRVLLTIPIHGFVNGIWCPVSYDAQLQWLLAGSEGKFKMPLFVAARILLTEIIPSYNA